MPDPQLAPAHLSPPLHFPQLDRKLPSGEVMSGECPHVPKG